MDKVQTDLFIRVKNWDGTRWYVDQGRRGLEACNVRHLKQVSLYVARLSVCVSGSAFTVLLEMFTKSEA